MEELILVEKEDVPAFIESNTFPVSLPEILDQHIIPVFVKDNEPLISHGEFVQCVEQVVGEVLTGEIVAPPVIRVSHPIKGRIPDARSKPANQLEEWEKTLYYERMMFVLNIPSIYENIEGNHLSLTVGGIKSYAQDNLYGRKGTDEHFSIFIGFQNKVCTNMCIWTDGLKTRIRVRNTTQLMQEVYGIVTQFNQERTLGVFRSLPEIFLSEHQFATLIGKCKLYQYLPTARKKEIPPLLFGDSQVGFVAREYFHDRSFSRDVNGSINLWKLYNLFTSANKSSYIDGFLPRSVNATSFILQLAEDRDTNWFLN